MDSVLDRIGGELAIQAAVVRFYAKVMADSSIAPFFGGLDMDRQVEKQIAFMRAILGGTTAGDLRAAHASPRARGLTDEHFETFSKLLAETLVELEIDEEAKTQILERMERQRDHVLGR